MARAKEAEILLINKCPLLTMGIPSNPVTALMIGALLIQGITPGPQLITERPELFWGVITSMWIGNLMLVVLNLPMIGIWVKILTVPYRSPVPVNHFLLLRRGLQPLQPALRRGPHGALRLSGYVFVKLECEPAPLILGPLMEENLRRAMQLASGDATVFITKPISGVLLGAALVLLLVTLFPAVKKTRMVAFKE